MSAEAAEVELAASTRPSRRAARLPWVAVALAAALATASRVLFPETQDRLSVESVAWVAIVVVMAALGALVASHEPRNPISWILCGLPLGVGLIGFAEGYLEKVGAAGGDASEWVDNWAWVPLVLVPLTFLPLYFPHGRLPSRRWRFLPWCAWLGIVSFWFSQAFTAGPLHDHPGIENPFAIDHPLVDAAAAGVALVAIAVVAGGVSVVVRFRRSHGVERQQMKWLAFAGALAVGAFVLAAPLAILWSETASNAVVLAAILLLPVAMAIAMLRYGLYEIDLLINRTLVYGGLTVSVVAMYVLVVGGMSLLFHDRASPWLALPATGLAAALFQPLRGALQRRVDRLTHTTSPPRRGVAARLREMFAPETAELRRSRERLVAAREEERRRLRRDLHDELGPALAGAALKVGTAEHVLAADPAAAARLLDDAGAELRDAVGEVRRMVAALRPPALDELGLAGALREQARRLASAAPPLQIDVAVAGELENLPAAVEAAAYRIAIEAMTNVARHAQARSCWVRIERNGELCLEITDDGAGTPARQRPGVGIASMVARAEELGGACIVDAAAPSGYRVRARLPLGSA